MTSPEDLEQLKRAHSDLPVENVILRRWSPRAFADRDVSSEDLKTIFTAASWAASSNNEQPWRFLVGIKGDETWTKIFDALVPGNQNWAKAAPVLYAAVVKKTFASNGAENSVAQHDVGAACATLSLQATALGLHTHGMAGFEGQKLVDAFGIPSDCYPISCWALGYLGDADALPERLRTRELQPRTRNPLAEFVFSAWDKAATL